MTTELHETDRALKAAMRRMNAALLAYQKGIGTYEAYITTKLDYEQARRAYDAACRKVVKP